MAEPLNALTIDLEDWYQGLQIDISEWSRFEDRIERSTDRVLTLLEEAGAIGTFFTLGHVADKHPDVVRAVVSAGHEIATHGWSHRLVYEQSPEVFAEELRASIDVLEEITGRPVIGYRAPFFSITNRSLWALDLIAEAGLRYDSSIFPVRNWRYGIADAPRWPHERQAGGATLKEFPISTWRVGGRNIPAAGGAYFRLYPYRVTLEAMRAINRAGKPAVFYLHPWELDPDHPRIPLPRRIALTHYANLRATERRFRRLLREVPFAPMREVLDVG